MIDKFIRNIAIKAAIEAALKEEKKKGTSSITLSLDNKQKLVITKNT